MVRILNYSELIELPSYEERFAYLQCHQRIGESTFGSNRGINQRFYRSAEWKTVRDFVIFRDECCDLAILDRPIFSNPIVHHMNPIDVKDIYNGTEILLNPEFLISVSLSTHTGIHFGDKNHLEVSEFTPRKRGDTSLW